MESDIKGTGLSFAQIIAAVSIALLYYDYCLTFTREVEWFWFASSRFSWASVFFFANRYMSVLGHIPYIYEFYSFRNDPERLKICIGLRSFRENICFVTQTFVGFFLITRTYALWNRNKYILWLLVGLSVPVIIYTIVVFVMTHHKFFDITYEKLRPFSCLVEISDERSYKMLTSWICVLIVDAIIVCLSAYKVIQIASNKDRPPILHLLLRDGIIYFGLVSVGCLICVLNYWPGVFEKDPYSRGCAEILANSLSSALASRLFLNLRDPTLCSRNRRVDHFTTGTRFDFVQPHRQGSGYPDDDVNNGQGHDRTMTVQLQTLEELPEPEESPSDEGMKYERESKYGNDAQSVA